MYSFVQVRRGGCTLLFRLGGEGVLFCSCKEGRVYSFVHVRRGGCTLLFR